VRIAVVHNFHRSSSPSGEDTVVRAEHDALLRAGHEVRTFGVSNDDMDQHRWSSLRAAVVTASGRGGRVPLSELIAFNPDVVHVHNVFPHLGTTWLHRVEAPVVVTLHNYRPMCANGYFLRDGAPCTLCADGKPWSGARFGCYRDSRVATLPLTFRSVLGPTRDRLLRRADLVIVPSPIALEQFARAGVPRDKLRVGLHFVPDSLVEPLGTAVSVPRESAPWVFVGRLTAEKGIDRLIDEWPTDVELRVVGTGALRDDLEAAAKRKCITFLGGLERAEAAREMRDACGVVFPSVWFEVAPVIYVEALAVGTPLLAFEPNAVAAFVTQDGTGSVARWGHVAEDVASATASFPNMRHACRAVFLEKHSEARFVRDRVATYVSLITAGDRVSPS